MIEIISAEYVGGRRIKISFSDGASGEYDLTDILKQNGALLEPLRDESYFRAFFIECGALCWKNGLELAPGNIYRRLSDAGLLGKVGKAA
jgi:hypothetical protein